LRSTSVIRKDGIDLDLPTKSEFVVFFANWLFKPILPFTHVNHEIELVSAIEPAGFILTHIPHERHDAKKIQKTYQLGVGLNPNSPSLLSWNLALLVCLRSLAVFVALGRLGRMLRV
jgi:hypothetical protein